MRKLFFLILFASHLIATADVTPGPIVPVDPVPGNFGFESGDLEGWSLKRLPRQDHAVVNSDHVRAGSFAIAVGLAPLVRYKDGWKNELSDKLLAPVGEEIWYRVSHFIPRRGFNPAPENSCMFAQWHNASTNYGWSPLLAHRYENGELRVTIGHGKVPHPLSYEDVANITFYKAPLEREKWHDFVYRAVWSMGGEGMVQGWHNGKFMGTYSGPIGYGTDDNGPYFKMGVYCNQTPENILIIYHDEYRRGRTKESILLPDEKLEEPPAP